MTSKPSYFLNESNSRPAIESLPKTQTAYLFPPPFAREHRRANRLRGALHVHRNQARLGQARPDQTPTHPPTRTHNIRLGQARPGQARPNIPTRTHTHTLTHSHTRTDTLTHSHTHTHSLTLTHTHTHTHTDPHTDTHIHILTHTHSQ